MEVIERQIPNTYEFPKFLNNYLSNTNFAILDIETTGLNSNFNNIILIGILHFDLKKENIIITQYFAKNYNDEKDLLLAFIDKIQNFKIYITYNGSSFDIPFINKRLNKYNIPFELDTFYNLDILRIVKNSKDFLGLKDCKLKTIENFLGIERKDTISGKESVDLYKTYLKTKEDRIKNKILLHNYEDILHLVPTLKILDYLNINKIYKFLPNEIVVFPDKSLKAKISNYKIQGDYIDIKGKIFGNIDNDLFFFNEGFYFTIYKKGNTFRLKLPIINIKLPTDDKYCLINIDEIDFIKGNLQELERDKRKEYIIKENNNFKEENLFKITKFFMGEICKKIFY